MYTYTHRHDSWNTHSQLYTHISSLKSIQVLLDADNDRFNLMCNGKNGIFIDGIFHRKTDNVADAIPLNDQ